jgi:hypothetical protein
VKFGVRQRRHLKARGAARLTGHAKNIVREDLTRSLRRPDRTDRFWLASPTRIRKVRLMPLILVEGQTSAISECAVMEKAMIRGPGDDWMTVGEMRLICLIDKL